jgi:hypothetical protein
LPDEWNLSQADRLGAELLHSEEETGDKRIELLEKETPKTTTTSMLSLYFTSNP